MNINSNTATNRETPFQKRLDGRFEGIMRWPQLDDLWKRVRQVTMPWYFYQVGSQLPDQPMSGQALADAIKELDALLRREHDYDYCGIVYADRADDPTLIKVYDPNNLGSSCGCSGARIPPRWIISHQRPELIVDDAPTPNNRKRWWNQLFRLR